MSFRALTRERAHAAVVSSFLMSACCTVVACGLVLDLPEAALDPSFEGGSGGNGSSGGAGSSSSGSGTSSSSGVVPTCTADLQSDPAHCGRCDLACDVGSACESGVCQAVVVIRDQAFPKSTAVANGRLYWPTFLDGKVQYFDTSAAQPSAVPFATVGTPQIVRILGDDVYIGTQYGLYHCTTTDCSGPTTVGESSNQRGMQVTADALFYTSNTDPYAGLARLDRATTKDELLLDSAYYQNVALSPDTAFAAGPDGIHAVPKGGSPTPLTFAGGGDLPGGVATDSTRVYYTIVTQGAAPDEVGYRMLSDLNQGGTYPSATSFDPSDIATDGAYVFWTNSGDPNTLGSVLACPVAGCTGGTAMVVAHDVKYPNSLSIDDKYVYFATYAEVGSIYRAVKPRAAR